MSAKQPMPSDPGHPAPVSAIARPALDPASAPAPPAADATHATHATHATQSSRRPYQPPRILFREPLEAMAAICSPHPPAKANKGLCPMGPISS